MDNLIYNISYMSIIWASIMMIALCGTLFSRITKSLSHFIYFALSFILLLNFIEGAIFYLASTRVIHGIYQVISDFTLIGLFAWAAIRDRKTINLYYMFGIIIFGIFNTLLTFNDVWASLSLALTRMLLASFSILFVLDFIRKREGIIK